MYIDIHGRIEIIRNSTVRGYCEDRMMTVLEDE